MWPGTSPSIAFVLENPSNGTTFQTAFEGSNGDLWTTGALGTGDLNLGMMTGTSPAITHLGNGTGAGYEIAFQANTGQLWGVLPVGPRADDGTAARR